MNNQARKLAKAAVFAFIVLAVVIIVFYVESREPAKIEAQAVLNGKTVKLEIADTDAERFQGLSDRETLCDDCGMLFAFPDLTERYFVMRRMFFPLDMIWIKDDTITGISKNLAPEGANPETIYSSKEPVNYVLEVNGGFADKYGITPGQKIVVTRE